MDRSTTCWLPVSPNMLYVFQTIVALLIHGGWVTAVGGTQIDKDNSVSDPETAAEWDWSGIPAVVASRTSTSAHGIKRVQ